MGNILITGFEGFLGKTLIKHLSNFEGVNILTFGRGNSINELSNSLDEADFIFHFAGEVRPQSNYGDFILSNVSLTEDIISLLIKKNKKTPILFTSTIHAIDPKNAYGESKKQAENTIIDYGDRQSVNVWIYRLSHIFGPGCKPNYNSVISTWIYNAIHGHEIDVYDRNVEMNYCYSLDLIQCFCKHLGDTSKNESKYLDFPNTYKVTLGNLVDEIFLIKDQGELYNPSNEFNKKLFDTYVSYS